MITNKRGIQRKEDLKRGKKDEQPTTNRRNEHERAFCNEGGREEVLEIGGNKGSKGSEDIRSGKKEAIPIGRGVLGGGSRGGGRGGGRGRLRRKVGNENLKVGENKGVDRKRDDEPTT
eukprot:CAMPEP_0201519172 /NCGR_PEP_ID=MMETSP0161_2-20130828/9793_1 /ASSEMBLY_ACC=CAM_ASM_000251 /TAXON_ID=180227 /ORGANISM="Neoparamoeba aestuarina, Strain SoJaBio B1-5/56/2" /LENGTH=117 /DNA_ID=CAMNT_0047917125 /DNA_START=345 /DNA_END=698 /DNA_ORIENTATION=+